MANTWKWVGANDVGTTTTALTVDAAGTTNSPAASMVWNLPRVYICNITAAAIAVTVSITDGTTTIQPIKGKPLNANDTMILEHIVLTNGWRVEVQSDTATSIDSYASVEEDDA